MSHKTGSRFPANAVAVDSSALAQLAYNEPRATLHVAFHDGTIHQYLGVPPHIYQELMGAKSKGVYFNRHVRNTFPNQKGSGATPGA